MEEDRAHVPGQEGSKRGYPFVQKYALLVRLYFPSHKLTGRMHCAKGELAWDVLNKGPRFLPITGVDLAAPDGSRESEINFVAVNKEQIVSLEELSSPLMEFHHEHDTLAG